MGEFINLYWPVVVMNMLAFSVLVFGNDKSRGVSPLSIYMAVALMVAAHGMFGKIRDAERASAALSATPERSEGSSQ